MSDSNKKYTFYPLGVPVDIYNFNDTDEGVSYSCDLPDDLQGFSEEQVLEELNTLLTTILTEYVESELARQQSNQ